MAGRFILLLIGQALAVGWAAWSGDVWPALAIALLLPWPVLLWDDWQARRVLRWLRQEAQAAAVPHARGRWAEVTARVSRLLRAGERREAASDARLKETLSALQASPNGVILLDAQGHIEWCNFMAEQHFGLERARDTAQAIGNLLRAPEFTAYWAAGDFSRDVILPGRGHSHARPVRIAAQIFPYGDGRHLLLSRDITALEQAEAMRRDFVANVSHEIRTPLTVLVGFVETLQTLPLDETERARYLALMAQQGARMQNLVEDLLSLSRLEGSPPPGLEEWTPAQLLLAHCEQEARALSARILPADAAPHSFHFPDADSLQAAGELAGNRLELQSALSNLVSNAVRYTPAGGSIRVSWQRQQDGSARFAVRDTGVGIAAEHLPRLTERFYRVERSRSRDTGGTGLGLAIVKHVVQRHGASLQISSQLGQGTEFAVLFPAARWRATADATPAVPNAALPELQNAPGQREIAQRLADGHVVQAGPERQPQPAGDQAQRIADQRQP
ncbi:sensory histidine kinase in two-component regulatory system with PhoB [Sterolibacterium denitrificans]|uniref:Phosphate regulon sensor protein PhoR n=1 Tax=Sterolibacterium denitrificans TaxID=157592 RepID=A0A7Z7HS40_9PROT|nr:sensory histidine kinase in two-component regulatory system with PhoB [Sterolibacterium denitrificans]